MFTSHPSSSSVELPYGFDFLSNQSLPFLIDEINLAAKALEDEKSTPSGIVNGHLIKLNVPDELVIIGDLHGDLGSLISILEAISFRRLLSNPDNKMIFLGDYIDRGSDSTRVLQAICHLKRKYPSSVVLLCGNHEAIERFPFSGHDLPRELYARYGADGRFVYEKLLYFFRSLPKAVIIKGNLLVTHGGLPTFISGDDFVKDISKDDDNIVEELLWNDPRSNIPENKDWCYSRRGFGKHFGKNVSRKCLASSGTKALVRGHEPCHGFKIDHDNMVLTLFSSKEAYQKFDAAYLYITKEELLASRNAADLAKHVKKIKKEN